MTNEHLPSAAQLLAEPDKYREMYREQLQSAQLAAHGAKIMLKKIEILTREDDEIRDFQANGWPEPRSHTRRAESEAEAAEEVPVTRKPKVVRLLSQDPGREWSVREIGEALGIENQKSLRVTLEEMVKAGTLLKTSDARYQYAATQPFDA